MERPPRTPQPPPRIRLWHRWAVVEVDLHTGARRVNSWHSTRYGASTVQVDLYAVAIDGPALASPDWYVYRSDDPRALDAYRDQLVAAALC